MNRLVLCALLLMAHGAVAQEIPAPQGYVSDYAELLSAQARERLTALLRELEAKTTVEIAVLTVKTTKPLDEFQYAVRVFDEWKIGKRGQDNGALFLVASEDRRVRVLTGYGLEGILPDGKVGAILDEFVLPYFREGRYEDGIYKGVWAVALVIAQDANVELTGEAPVDIRRISEDGRVALPFILLVVVAIIFLSLMMRSARRSARGGPFPWWVPIPTVGS
ncbi:MAG: TPM domain-containing protein, partial [Candidatus Bipolaricaulota bacterium]|nr:TPM domain-containing protein [Candidatus Bipolaricaulota bacterium]